MVEIITIPALVLGLYALWIVGMPDFLRIAQGVRHVRARVVKHVSGPDGYNAIYAFQHGHRTCEVPAPTAYASPKPAVGSEELLSYPRRRPDLARPPQPLGRFLLYFFFAAWLGFFSDLLFGWL